ncbi:MAG: sugar ABC transporter permease [Lachnospiraceae bacterium]|nr:sugar ABC transporter permease [Lachnospiraceae bacterium]
MAKNDILLLNHRNKRTFFQNLRHNWPLHVMMLFPFVYVLLFNYYPMYGIQIAWKDYKPRAGIEGSAWVGWKWFQKFFANYKWKEIVLNTLAISTYSIAVGFPIPIILALIINTNRHSGLKKVAQNVSYLPHFISTVVMVGLLNQIFNPNTGLLGAIGKTFGIIIKGDLRGASTAFRHLYVWSGVWQGMGWSAIIYVSALAGVSMELHEAAEIDGASRFRRIFVVDLPAILPTISIMLILRAGSIMSVGFEKTYLMQKSTNTKTSEIISTYVYKEGLINNQMGFGTAVGLMNNVFNTGMVLLANWIANLVSGGERGLF